MKNWFPSYSSFAKSMMMWMGMAMFFPMVIFLFAIEDCRAAGLDDLVWQRSNDSLQLSKIYFASNDDLWFGIGYQRNSVPCGDRRWCQEWVYEASNQVWGLEFGLQSIDINKESEIFLGANAGSAKGLISAVKERVNPLATEYLTFFISFVLFF